MCVCVREKLGGREERGFSPIAKCVCNYGGQNVVRGVLVGE